MLKKLQFFFFFVYLKLTEGNDNETNNIIKMYNFILDDVFVLNSQQ